MEKRNWIIAALCVAIVGMGIGFAAMATNLEIGGTANLTGDWKVEFANIEESTTTPPNGAEGTLTFIPGTTTATFNVDLEYPGATYTYDIEIKNNGTIPAKFVGIAGVDTANNALPAEIQFTLSGTPTIGTALAAGASHNYTLTVTWVGTSDSVPAQTSKQITLTFAYGQNTGA